ncbi:glycosyltransferase family 2 protein [Uliginosibacterium gangwonense]|uniref:glycosyltransferase family 2 protein n=1 Tax=Uliginosibacterium gangwonense TaxID=392736 RepID=UPI00037A706B|nr:glycosyltransferase [Uliginosibacterium gangwonense]
MSEVAVLLTCFNRREKTLACLQRLFILRRDLDVFLVDDSSTDGTGNAVAELFPQVQVIQGNGALFWNRGMYLAWSVAAKRGYRYYLWVNDDVVVYEHCLGELFECVSVCQDRAVLVGLVDAGDGQAIYGGTDSAGRLLQPNGEMQEVYHMNGNVVLVPAQVFDIVGNLDPVYHHDLGDVDYGYRARAQGLSVVTSKSFVARGEKNDFCRIRLWGSDLRARFRRLYSPLGNPPTINFYFRRKHKGVVNAVVYYMFIHLINIAPDWVVRLVYGNRYIGA